MNRTGVRSDGQRRFSSQLRVALVMANEIDAYCVLYVLRGHNGLSGSSLRSLRTTAWQGAPGVLAPLAFTPQGLWDCFVFSARQPAVRGGRIP